MKHPFAVTGFTIGILAVGTAAFEQHLSSPNPREQTEDSRSVGQLAGEAAKRLLKEKFLKPEPQFQVPEKFPPARVAYTLLGVAAIGLGTFSWVRKEHVRLASGAAALGLLAVYWPWVMVGVMLAVLLFLLANLLG
jgi:hypothetical protein